MRGSGGSDSSSSINNKTSPLSLFYLNDSIDIGDREHPSMHSQPF
jgi:hypothetical protein